ncbi:MAG: SdrD B-like domain-containing protein [Xenococcaceae cyanobacterium MO_188.B19]|nr:SdrD B-like domain-containing protein [Xenococcaceae cyanobacterium MO_188.B19]
MSQLFDTLITPYLNLDLELSSVDLVNPPASSIESSRVGNAHSTKENNIQVTVEGNNHESETSNPRDNNFQQNNLITNFDRIFLDTEFRPNLALSRAASFSNRFRDFPQYFTAKLSSYLGEPLAAEDFINRYVELFFIPKDTKPTIPEPQATVSDTIVFTDKDDYSPGETATIFGNNFDIGETIKLQVLHTDGIPNTGSGHESWFITDGGAGDLDGVADGNFRTTWYVNPDDSLNSTFELTAIGQTSESTATHTFTDSDPAVQFFYVPGEEADILEAIQSIATNTGDNYNSATDIQTVISITVSTDDSIIYYDHWEDGYETDINNPTQSSTQVWGDNDPSNGIAPGFTVDVLNAGDIIAIENFVDVANTETAIDYDGRDKIGASKAIVVSRAAWPAQNSDVLGDSGTLIGGAVEVYDTSKWGTNYEIPVGENIGITDFEYTSLFITASENGTNIEIDLDGNSATTADITSVTLNEGETYFVDGGILAGTTVTASKPLQAQLLTGDVESRFASRSYTLLPVSEWDNNYYTPVGTIENGGANTSIFLYNPDSSNITVKYDTQNLTAQEVTVNAGSFATVTLPFDADSGARFYTDNQSDTFWAVTSFDSLDSAHDWGFSLVPENNLNPVIQVGWAPGNGNKDENGNPLWVMANLESGETTTIYIDYDGDGVAPFTDINGGQYDEARTLSALEITQIIDTKNNDFDQSGIRVYTVDGTGLAAAWGQDPNAATAGTSLDFGTTVLPLPVSSSWKSSTLADGDGDGLGDEGETITYNINVQNDGVVFLGNVKVSDIIPEGTTYVPGSTTVTYIGGKVSQNGDTGISVTTTSIADDSTGTAFPLDDDGTDNGFDAGLNIGNIDTEKSAIVSFQVTINDPYDGTSAFVTNGATVDSDEESFTVAVQTELDSTIVPNTQTKTLYLSDDSGSGGSSTDLDRIDPINSGDGSQSSLSIPSVRDDFSTTSYSVNDGTVNWTTDWIETNDDETPNNVTGSDILILNGTIYIDHDDTTPPSIEREVDLSDSESAVLSFNFLNTTDTDATDSVVIEASDDGGSNYTILETFTGDFNSATLRSYDLENYIDLTANTRIRFRVADNSSYTGDNEFFRIGFVEIVELVTFTQSISIQSDFVLSSDNNVTVSTLIDVSNGTPDTNSDLVASLTDNSGTLVTLDNIISADEQGTGSGVYLITWQETLTENITIPAGNTIGLDILDRDTNLEFNLLYDSNIYDPNVSKIDLPTTTVINIDSIDFYNDSSTNGGNQINAASRGDTVYVRVQVSDPFGDYDITGLTLDINDAEDNNVVPSGTGSVNVTNIVDTSGDGIKIFEYQWDIDSNADLENYTITAVATEGLESSPITDTDTVTFTVNDSIDPDVFIGDASVTEGTPLVFDVTLTQESTTDIILDLTTTPGTATEVGDYENQTFEYSIDGGNTFISAGGTNGTQVTIPAGSTGIKVRIDSVSDTTDEPDETFTLGVSSVVSGSVNNFADTGTGTILDDDAEPNISINDVTLTEGDSDTKQFTFTVTLDQVSNQTVTVGYYTENSTATTTNNDYTGIGSMLVPETLTFAPGETSRTVTVLVTGDTPEEPDETFNVNLINAVNANITDAVGVGTIINDDDNTPDVIIGDASVVEDHGTNGNQLVFDVSLTSASDEDITITLAASGGTAIGDTDYETTGFEYSTDNGVTWTAATGTNTTDVIIPANQTSIKVRIDSAFDTDPENNETFILSATDATGADTGTAAVNQTFSDTGTGTIIDNDDTPTAVINDVALAEGDSGTTSFTFTVSLDKASTSVVTVDYYTSDGTATTTNSDYTALGSSLSPLSLTFDPGETSKTITVDVTGDTPVENDETFTVTLASATNANISTIATTSNLSGVENVGTGTIQNDDDNLGSIRGTVFADTDNDNAGESPLQGVTIELLDSDGNSIDSDPDTPNTQPTITTTDATGSYSFMDVVPGDYIVKQTNLSGYADVSDNDRVDDDGGAGGVDDDTNSNTNDNLIPVSLSNQESDTGNDFIDEQTGTISGEVLADTNNDDIGDAALAGVTIQLFEDGNTTAIATTTTNSTGNYSFTDVEPGNYTLVETNPSDYGDVKDSDTNADSTADGAGGNTDKNVISVALSAGGISTGNDFVDERGVIRGNVKADTNNDGDGEVNLENVTITLTNTTTSATVTTTTDASGNYIFADLPSGTYTVVETNLSGYADVSEQDSVTDDVTNDTDLEGSGSSNDNILDVVLIAGEEDSGNDFIDEALPETIAGKVLEDTNGDGVGDSPLAGVLITLSDTDGSTADLTTTTNEDGEYSFDVSATGADIYTLTTPNSGDATVENYNYLNELDSVDNDGGASGVGNSDADNELRTENNNRTLIVDLATGESDTGNDFVYEAKPGTISGTVFADDGSGNVGKDGVVLTLLDGDGNPVLDGTGNAITATTSGGGTYSFSNLEPGDYQIVKTDPTGYSSVSDSDQTDDDAGATGTDNTDNDTNTNTNDNILIVNLGAGETDSGNNFFDQLNASINGTVLEDTNGDGSGNTDAPIGGVTVTLKDSDDNTVATDVTDSNGDYSFINVTPGNYTVVETDLNGYSSITDTDSVTDAGGNDGEIGSDGSNDNIISVSLSAGETDSGNDFVDAQNGSISGSVKADTTGNDAGDTALSGVTITLRNASDDSTVATTTTDTTGNYSFNDVAPGNYEVVETNPDGYVDVNELDSVDDDGGATGSGNTDSDNETAGANDDNILSVTLVSGESDTGNDFVNEQTGTISGTVFEENNNGNGTTGDIGLVGVEVRLQDRDNSNATLATAITAGDGTYSFTNVAPGNYRLRQINPTNYTNVLDGDTVDDGNDDTDANGDAGFNSNTNNQIIFLDFVAGETDTGNDFVVEVNATGLISGNVSEDTDGDGAGDTPLENINITLDDGVNTPTTIQTDADGNYSFTGLANGTYTITQENLSGYGNVAESDGTNNNTIGTITINNDASTGNNFVDGLEASISGVVWEDLDSNGIRGQFEDVISGVSVTLTRGGADGLLSTAGDNTIVDQNTGTDGTYSFTGLNPGEEYQVSFPTTVSGYNGLTTQDTGSDNTIDSDVNNTTGIASNDDVTSPGNIITLDPGEDKEKIDAGYLPNTTVIDGTDSSETLSGGTGDETIIGYKGQDTLSGGGGSDTFFYNETSDGIDIITDFTSGDDKLDFSKIVEEIENYVGSSISNPISSGYIIWENFSGVGTMVRADFDNTGSLNPKDVVFLQNPNDTIVAGDFIL